MGLLSRQPEPDEPGEPLGNRSIRSFIKQGEIVRGGERPEVIDTSRPGSEPAAGVMAWSRPEVAAAPEKVKDLDEIQRGYEELFE